MKSKRKLMATKIYTLKKGSWLFVFHLFINNAEIIDKQRHK